LLRDLPPDSDEGEGEREGEPEDYEEGQEGQEGELRPQNVKELRDLLDETRRMSVSEPGLRTEEGFVAFVLNNVISRILNILLFEYLPMNWRLAR
jgi:hypothetical protein